MLKGKKIAIVLAFRNFRDVEYFVPEDVLTQAGAKIFNVSSEKGTAVGDEGGEVEIDFLAKDLKVDDFDGIVFVGGAGMGQQLENEDFQQIARKAMALGKILGAICIAPALLAKAGVLAGRKATVWSGPLEKDAIKVLEAEGAQYQEKDVVVDKRLVTACGPQVAQKFAQALVGVLTSFSG
jgi:protease I